MAICQHCVTQRFVLLELGRRNEELGPLLKNTLRTRLVIFLADLVVGGKDEPDVHKRLTILPQDFFTNKTWIEDVRQAVSVAIHKPGKRGAILDQVRKLLVFEDPSGEQILQLLQ